MKKINWGIIGVGDVTEVKSGPAFNKIEHSQIHTVMRRNLEKASDYARRHGIPRYTNNADDIIKNNEIDAVYIATPPSSHYDYTIRAANSGKHVYVEKPMALNYEQCVEMIEVCNHNKVKLFVAYYRRELDYFKKIKSLIDTDEIGSVKFVQINLMIPLSKSDISGDQQNWRVNPEIAGAGYFYDLASHQFDFLDLILGQISEAKGTFANQKGLYPAEDIVSASFKFGSNILGNGLWCFTMNEGNRVDETIITGEKGIIKFSFFDAKPIELLTVDKNEMYEIKYPQHVQEQLIRTVISDIQGIGICQSTGISGARTNLVLDQILYNSHQ